MDNQVEVAGEKGPEWVVQVDGETAAVTENEPRAIRVPVAPQDDDRVVVYLDTVGG